MTQKLREATKAAADAFDKMMGTTATYEEVLDGLGLEDFPERDYFIEAGKLLREAARALNQAHSITTAGAPGAEKEEACRWWRTLADRINKLLAGK
jgi:dsDNA-binding SOS-regulon protein